MTHIPPLDQVKRTARATELYGVRALKAYKHDCVDLTLVTGRGHLNDHSVTLMRNDGARKLMSKLGAWLHGGAVGSVFELRDSWTSRPIGALCFREEDMSFSLDRYGIAKGDRCMDREQAEQLFSWLTLWLGSETNTPHGLVQRGQYASEQEYQQAMRWTGEGYEAP